MNPEALRSAIFAKLNVSDVVNLLSTEYTIPAVFHEVAPQVDDSGAAKYFPYVSFSFPSSVDYSDKDVSGSNSIVQVDVWSRIASTQREVIAQAVYDQLHRKPLDLADHITTECESMTMSLDPDGQTRRAMLRFRVLALA